MVTKIPNELPTADNIRKHHIRMDAMCPRCNDSNKDLHHAFKSVSMTGALFAHLRPMDNIIINSDTSLWQ